MYQRPRIRLIYRQRMTLKMRLLKAMRQRGFIYSAASVVAFILFFGYFNLMSPTGVYATSDETLSSGSFIINMGITPQTYANGLKPYGMLYDLIYNYNVPVKWVINSSKVKDGADFTYNGIDYKGGTFIIRAEDITSSVTTRITYWQGQGVQGVYTAGAITVPVYATLTYFPKAMIDNLSNNQNIITGYYTNAALPATSYDIGDPTQLTSCHDIWINPHGDPLWSTHSPLYNFVTAQKSSIWSECHAVSVMEGVTNTSSPFQQLDYLSTNGLQCYSSGKCGAGVTQTHAGNPTAPYTHNYPTDPVMQFMGTMDGATNGGSEKWYIPQTTGAWRGTTKRLVTTSDGASPNEGALMVYGRAYGNANNGYVMYEAGHDIDGNGTTAEKVAAQRAFFNYLLVAGSLKQVVVLNYTIPSSLIGNETSQVLVNVNSGTPPYTFAWTSTVGGSFANAAKDTTNFTSPIVASPTTGVLKCVITDACGRKQIVSSIITIGSSVLPVTLIDFSAKEFSHSVQLEWATASEVNNNYFTLSRSNDALEFTELAKINGAGTRTTKNAYSYCDMSPAVGNNYYRLSQTDYDGTTKVIGVKMVNIKESADEIFIYPNPFSEKLNIRFENTISPAAISLTNIEGKLFYADNIKIEHVGYEYSINALTKISSGIYFVSVSQNQKKRTWRVLKR